MKDPARSRPASAPLARVALAGALVLPTALSAIEFECEQPGDRRFLRVDLPGESHLCEVSVTAGTDGERRVLWYADNDTGFCFERLEELAEKYIDEFGFECQPWPDRDGIEQLSVRQRTIVENELKTLIARGDDLAGGAVDDAEAGADAEAAEETPEEAASAAEPLEELAGEDEEAPSRLAVEAIRAVASRSAEGQPAMLALQLFRRDGSDLVRVIADEGDRRELVAGVERLADWVSPIEGVRVLDAVVESVGDDGTIEVLTRLAPANSGSDGPFCGGRQALQASAEAGLVARTPHRHVCTAAVTVDGGR